MALMFSGRSRYRYSFEKYAWFPLSLSETSRTAYRLSSASSFTGSCLFVVRTKLAQFSNSMDILPFDSNGKVSPVMYDLNGSAFILSVPTLKSSTTTRIFESFRNPNRLNRSFSGLLVCPKYRDPRTFFMKSSNVVVLPVPWPPTTTSATAVCFPGC